MLSGNSEGHFFLKIRLLIEARQQMPEDTFSHGCLKCKQIGFLIVHSLKYYRGCYKESKVGVPLWKLRIAKGSQDVWLSKLHVKTEIKIMSW